MKSLNKTKKRAIIFIAILCYYALIYFIIAPIFGTRDDEIMRNLLMGKYTQEPDSHAIFIGYPLGWLISGLYKINAEIEWYGLIWSFLIAICTFLIIVDVLETKKNKKVKIICVLLLTFGVFTPVFIVQQFTVLSGILCGTAVYMLVVKKKLAAIVLMLLGYLVRYEVFYLSIPFILIILIGEAIPYVKEKNIKTVAKSVLPIVIS